MSHKQRGFTLIEILVVLSIFTILILLTVPTNNALLTKKTEEKILGMFQYDLLYLQNQSIASGSEENLKMTLYKNSYTLTDINNVSTNRQLPAGWEIEPRNLNFISFNHNGTIRFAGTIVIHSPKNSFKITFPIGKGRGYIEKQ